MGSEMPTPRLAPGGLWVTSGSLRPCVLFPDVNECSQENGSCSQICYNKPGSFQCGCYSGYALSLDGRTCHGEALGPGCPPRSSSPIFFCSLGGRTCHGEALGPGCPPLSSSPVFFCSLDGRTCRGEALGPGCPPVSSPVFFCDCQVAGWLKPQSLCSLRGAAGRGWSLRLWRLWASCRHSTCPGMSAATGSCPSTSTRADAPGPVDRAGPAGETMPTAPGWEAAARPPSRPQSLQRFLCQSGPRTSGAGVGVGREPRVPLFTAYKISAHKWQKGKVALIRMPAIWGDGALSVPQKPPPKILLSRESF